MTMRIASSAGSSQRCQRTPWWRRAPTTGLGGRKAERNQGRNGNTESFGEIRNSFEVETRRKQHRIDLPIGFGGKQLRLIRIRCVVHFKIAAEQSHRELLELTVRCIDDQDSAVWFHGQKDRLIARQSLSNRPEMGISPEQLPHEAPHPPPHQTKQPASPTNLR